MLHFLILYIDLRIKTKIKIEINKCIIKPIIATIIMGSVSYASFSYIQRFFNNKVSILIIIVFSIIIYVINIGILRIFTINDLEKINIIKSKK